MSDGRYESFDEVDHLIRNAQLRDELEPYLDEAVGRINIREFSTPEENEFLAQMLAWERAPVLPIADWFQPKLDLPHPDEFGGSEEEELRLHESLWQTIHQLFEKRVVLDFTEHLSDRELYCLVYRDILPSHEKKIDVIDSYLHWDCSNAGENQEIWLQYYASNEEREAWSEECGCAPPPRQTPPYPRQLPRRPL